MKRTPPVDSPIELEIATEALRLGARRITLRRHFGLPYFQAEAILRALPGALRIAGKLPYGVHWFMTSSDRSALGGTVLCWYFRYYHAYSMFPERTRRLLCEYMVFRCYARMTSQSHFDEDGRCPAGGTSVLRVPGDMNYERMLLLLRYIADHEAFSQHPALGLNRHLLRLLPCRHCDIPLVCHSFRLTAACLYRCQLPPEENK